MTDKIKYVAINGSERVDGNNARALEWAAEYLEKQDVILEVFSLASAKIDPCGPAATATFATSLARRRMTPPAPCDSWKRAMA